MHETYITCWVPSQSKSITKYLPNKESITLLLEAVYGLCMMTKKQWWRSGHACAITLTVECCCHQQHTSPKSCVEAMDGHTPKQVQQRLHELCKHRNEDY